MTEQAPLFDGYDDPPPDPLLELSPDQRRTARQAQQVAAGVHPLTGGPLHPLASRHRDRTAPRTDPFTCGSCIFRSVLPYHDRSYPKCLFGMENPTDQTPGRAPRVTNGAGSDVRAWWPACPDYSPGDTGLSPDAARSIPEGR